MIRLEVLIEALSWYDTLDNVHWGIGNGEPTPKISWLRFLRWKTYYVHLLLSGISFAPQDDTPVPQSPPNITSRDIERMGLTNCFALCKSSGQFESNCEGCHRAADPEEPLPKFSHVPDNDILVYQFKSIWTINLSDYDVESIWVYKGKSLSLESSSNDQPRLTRRQKRVQTYLANRYSEWGSKSSRKLKENETCVTEDIAESFKNDWSNERPAKQLRGDSDQR